jgi:putative transposase
MPTHGVIHRLRTVDYAQEYTFLVTFCVRDRVKSFADHRVATLARDVLLEYREAQWYRLWCYCIMPDHVHLMIRLLGRTRSLSRVVASIKNKITYRVRSLGVRIAWQHGFHDRVKRSFESLDEYATYILANPVRAGLVRECVEYPYCGIVDVWK